MPTPDPTGVVPSFAVPTPIGSGPAAVALSAGEPSAVGRAIAGAVRATERAATDRAATDRHARADGDPEAAEADADPGRHATATAPERRAVLIR